MATQMGAVTFEAGGRTCILQFTTNALVLLEDKIDKSPLDIATELELNPRLKTVRALFWAGGDDRGLTLAQVGDMIDEIGKARAIEIVREAYAAAFPEEKEEAKGEAGDPPVAVDG